MRKVAFFISILCLALTLVPSFLVFWEVISLETNKDLMLAGTIGWFLTAPYWMRQQQKGSPASENNS
jgi:hypothetical protein